MKKRRVFKATNDFVAEAIKVHGEKYSYSKTEYENNRKKVLVIRCEYSKKEEG